MRNGRCVQLGICSTEIYIPRTLLHLDVIKERFIAIRRKVNIFERIFGIKLTLRIHLIRLPVYLCLKVISHWNDPTSKESLHINYSSNYTDPPLNFFKITLFILQLKLKSSKLSQHVTV